MKHLWTLPNATGFIQTLQRSESLDGRLVIRDSWTCEETNRAFILHEFSISLEQNPQATLALIDPEDEVTVPVPSLLEMATTKKTGFSKGIEARARGIEIANVAKGVLRILAPDSSFVSMRAEGTKTMHLRFSPVTRDEPLRSTEVIYTLEWRPNQR